MAVQGVQHHGVSPKPHILSAAGAIGTATLLSRVLGLVREQVFAVLFGASNMTDAFNLAFRMPNLLRNLFAEGAMSAALVPTFARVRVERGDQAAWRLAGLVFRTLTATVSVLALLGWLFAPQLVELYASAFHEVPGKFEAAVRMTRIVFPFFPLVALAAAFMGVLNACGVFFLPALSPALFNLASIVVGVALVQAIYAWPHSGVLPIEGMAYGVLAGALVQAFCQLPALYRVGYRWQPAKAGQPSWRHDPDLRRMLWLMLPGTVGLAATQLGLLINTILATQLGPGAVSYLNYAFRLMQFPIGIFGASLAQAALPRLSAQWVEGDYAGVRSTLEDNLRRVLAVNLPATAGLVFLGYPIMEMIFQYGRFYAEDTRAASLALAMYALGLTGYSVVKLLVPACYALGNSRVPVIASVASIVATLVLNVATYREYGFASLALGTSVGAVLNATLLLYAVQKLLNQVGAGLPLRTLAKAFLAYLAVALTMGVACYGTHRGLNALCPDSSWVAIFGDVGWVLARVCKVSVVLVEGVVVAWFVSRKAGLQELSEAGDLFAKKLKNLLSPTKS